MNKTLEAALSAVPESLLLYLPGPVGRRLRAKYWRRRLGAMGDRCVIDVGVVISNPQHVYLGDDVWLDSYVQIIAGPSQRNARTVRKPNNAYQGSPGDVHLHGGNHIAPFCILQGHGGLSIGRDVGVASHSMIYTLSNHYRFDSADDHFAGDYGSVVKFAVHEGARTAFIEAPAVLQDGSALGLNSIVMPGATVGPLSWIAAGSVVLGDIPPGVIAGGNPARVLKQRFR